MEFIKDLRIKNFKSIKDLTLQCKRVNVFIGKPNVGKSNILEALDLAYLSSMMNENKSTGTDQSNGINIKEFFRVNAAADLFYHGNIREEIELFFFKDPPITLRYKEDKDNGIFSLKTFQSFITTEFDNNFIPLKDTPFFSSPIIPYKYKEYINYHDYGNYLMTLMPPYGNNMIEFIKYNDSFREFLSTIIDRQDLELNLDEANHKITIQLRKSKNVVYSLPYQALADTIKRVIFYTAAIESKQDIITLEEPEVHSFPPYVSMLGDKIIAAAETQFFIVTHSTVLLTNLIENTPKDELAVFVCSYDDKEHQTKVRALSESQLSEALVYGVDMFFNINLYLDDPIEHTT
jgi:AAA15 family ATPase/GTPase